MEKTDWLILAGAGVFLEIIGYYAATYMEMKTTTYPYLGQISTPTFPYMGLGYGLMGLGGIMIAIGVAVFIFSIMKQTTKEAIKEGIVEGLVETKCEGNVYCSACGFGNREGSRFCKKCGTRLS